MTDLNTKLEIFDAIAARRNERRGFLRFAGGGALAIGGATLLSACGNDDADLAPVPVPGPAPVAALNDADVLNFALNLEYLEAQFYAFATFGVGLNASLLTGTGTQGGVTGGAQVPFQDPIVREYAREIAIDEIAHVAFLRTALGSAAVAQPALDISAGTAAAPGAFTLAARAAGVVPATGVFNPYADDNSFLLGAYIFEDVGVSAYKGGAALIANKTYLEAAAGILAAEAYHAGLIRTILYRKGLTTPSLRTAAGQISDARDSLDGSSDIDQGITGTDPNVSNIVPTDANGLAYSRSVAQVHNIVYLTNTAKIGGGFFPNGTNNRTDALRSSGANA
ncbi:ferritin-like domain-containing protein [Sphingomonas sp. UV9]|uniref:ferritin-like domain-containing protein n=1 Tax=Sphingomonas sp. UV9 TaxID=1851410 RepID=UPI000FFBFC2E|nr:ferritin-like domain-containing protein [Sphingomonas sp. UV9]RXD03333.1 ferritin-like domain-containing protein [Sphingomonas sp. UV9]